MVARVDAHGEQAGAREALQVAVAQEVREALARPVQHEHRPEWRVGGGRRCRVAGHWLGLGLGLGLGAVLSLGRAG